MQGASSGLRPSAMTKRAPVLESSAQDTIAAERSVLSALDAFGVLDWDTLVRRTGFTACAVSDAVEELLARGEIRLIRADTPQPVRLARTTRRVGAVRATRAHPACRGRERGAR